MTNNVVYRSKSLSYKTGFIYVASNKPLFYELALLSAESLKSYYPEANITLFTHDDWVDDRATVNFSEIRTGIPCHKRAKMWCMARTPYDTTLYNDCDSQINRTKIKKLHDRLQNYDMAFGSNLAHTVADIDLIYADKERKHFVEHHGSFCLYKKSDIVLDFHQTWYDEYIKQTNTTWTNDWASQKWQKFDMFTLWSIINNVDNKFNKFKDLKIDILERFWNATIQDRKKDLSEPPVVIQIDKVSISKMPNMYGQIQNNLIKYPKIERNSDENAYI